MTAMMKLNITDTESTGKHILKESIEIGKNIGINQVIEMTDVVTKNGSQIVGITVVNTVVRAKNNNPQRTVCNSGNKNMIIGKTIFDCRGLFYIFFHLRFKLVLTLV